jgi:hypothetical protein
VLPGILALEDEEETPVITVLPSREFFCASPDPSPVRKDGRHALRRA